MASTNALFEKIEDQSDTLYFWLFPHDSEGNCISDLCTLEQLSLEYLAHLSPFINNYLWNCEPFNLYVKAASSTNEDSGPLEAHIQGSVAVGDYIEDEWFTVFLLKVLTKDYTGLICRVVDDDGEFLLIEAAEHLPTWVNPTTAEQRVYLKDGKVHLIPPSVRGTSSVSSSSNPLPRETPRVMDAIATVNARPSDTLANYAIQKAISFRIEEYPAKISKDQHIAHAYVPVGVAALLREYPTLVAPCVKAFCRRDEREPSKILRVMRHFPPEQRVQTAIRFSKALYAQLSAYSYIPDRLTGWNLPSSSHPSCKSHILGMKLACGFEILVCNAGGVTPHTPSTEGDLNILSNDDHCDLDTNPRWAKYKDSLGEKGYFRGETDGSKLYAELEENARRFFLSNVVLSRKDEEGAEFLSSGAVIIKLLSKVNSDYEFFKEREARLTPPDDENWLQLTPETLDEILESKYGKSVNSEKSEKEAMESLNTFLSNIPEADETDIPPELRDSNRKLSSDSSVKKGSSGHSRKPSSGGRKISNLAQNRKVSSQSNASEGSNTSDMSSFSNKIDFNAESFSDALNNILEFSVPEDDYWKHSEEDSSGMSSYDDEDDDLSLSRKTSNGSQESGTSKASSGVGPDHLDGYLKSLKKDSNTVRKQANQAAPAGCKPKRRGQRIPLADLGDEFEDVDNFDPVGVDMDEVKELMKKFARSGDASQQGSFGLKPASFGGASHSK